MHSEGPPAEAIDVRDFLGSMMDENPYTAPQARQRNDQASWWDKKKIWLLMLAGLVGGAALWALSLWD